MKVLQIIDGEQFGGIAKVLKDIENNMCSDIEFDFLTSVSINDNWKNLNISRKNIKGKIIYNHRLYRLLKKNKYDIVHINSGVFLFSFQIALIAKLAGVKNIVAHSHSVPANTKIKKKLIKLLNPIYRKIAKTHLACSSSAAKSLFTKTKNVTIIKDGIEIEKFKYNKQIRNKYRKELNLENKKVYGNIANFDKVKNHEFLINLFYELEKKQDSILLLVGTGNLENNIKEKVKKMNLEDKVIFLGCRKNINNLLNCMDVYLFPSYSEGLGITLIEAQTTGLPVVVSKGIPDEAKIIEEFYKIDSYEINEWEKVLENIKYINRKNKYKKTIENGYDIKEISKQLEQIYKDLVK